MTQKGTALDVKTVDEATQIDVPAPAPVLLSPPAGSTLAPAPRVVSRHRAPVRSSKRWIYAVVGVVALAATLAVVLPRKKAEHIIPPAPPISGNMLHEIGTIEALAESFVLTRYGGDITWKIEEGTFVNAGEPVVAFDTHLIEEDIEGRVKDLEGKKDNVRRAEADIELSKKKYSFNIRNLEIALELAQIDREKIFGFPTEDDKKDVELSLRSAELELKNAESDMVGYDDLVKRGFVSEAARRKKQVEYAQKKINASKARLIRDLTLQGSTEDSKRIAEMAVADAKKRLQISRFNRDADLAVLEANLELSKIDLENFDRELGRKRREMDMASVKAPAKGRVAFVDVWKGSKALSPIQVGETRPGGSDLCKICDTSSLRINIFVNEFDISRVMLKQRAVVKLAAFPGRTFEATVSEIGVVASDKNTAISPLASRSSGEAFVNVVNVKLDFATLSEEDRRDIRIGFTADVFIDLEGGAK